MSSQIKGSSAIEVPRLEKCCCFLSLEFGSLIIAGCFVLLWITVFFHMVTTDTYHETKDVMAVVARLIIEIGLAAMLFVGAQKRMSMLILLWVLVEFVLITLTVIVSVFVGVFTLNPPMLLGAAILGSFYTVGLVVVFNFYREVRDK